MQEAGTPPWSVHSALAVTAQAFCTPHKKDAILLGKGLFGQSLPEGSWKSYGNEKAPWSRLGKRWAAIVEAAKALREAKLMDKT